MVPGLTASMDLFNCFQSHMEREKYYALPAVTRYYNHIQHLQPINEARTLLRDTPFLLVEFDLDNMPAIERKVEVKEKKPKKDTKAVEGEGKKPKSAEEKVPAAVQAEKTPSAAEQAAPPAEHAKKQKKEKKEKAPQTNEGKKTKPAAEPATGPMPSMIDLRVGKVLEGKETLFSNGNFI